MSTSERETLISEILSAPGVAMIVGAIDTGKTQFCYDLCMAGLEAGIPTAIVDADVGQSEIGAPGTVGMALVEKHVESLTDIKPRRLYFVGATSPGEHVMECAIGTKKMVDAALGLGAKLVVVDTTGLVGGWLGRKLKTYKTDLIRPDYLVGIEKKHEIDHLHGVLMTDKATQLYKLVKNSDGEIEAVPLEQAPILRPTRQAAV